MTNAAFYEYLEAGADRIVQFDHLWQYALAVKACPDAIVEGLTEANPRIAAEFAQQEAVYEALNAPNRLHAAVTTAPDDDARLALIAAASADERAEYANDLALAEYTQDAICSQYVRLVLGES